MPHIVGPLASVGAWTVVPTVAGVGSGAADIWAAATFAESQDHGQSGRSDESAHVVPPRRVSHRTERTTIRPSSPVCQLFWVYDAVCSTPVQKAILLAGATGLVGAPLSSAACSRTTPPARRWWRCRAGRSRCPTKSWPSRWSTSPAWTTRALPPAEAALCALGTTIKQAGSQDAFRAVDHDAVLAFARAAVRAGCRTFVLVSSVGADRSARNFYLRVKGETEEAVAALGFARFVALRPSLMLGERGDRRPGEAVAQAVMPVIAPLLAGPLRRYRGISADAVAAAMIAAATDAASRGVSCGSTTRSARVPRCPADARGTAVRAPGRCARCVVLVARAIGTSF